MTWTKIGLVVILLSIPFGFVTCDFWDDFVDAIEDTADTINVDVGDIVDDVRGFVDGAGEFLDDSNLILIGSDIDGNENSTFDDSFNSVKTGTDGNDVGSLLNQLQTLMSLLQDLLSSEYALSQDEIYDIVTALLIPDVHKEDLDVNQDEMFELLLSSMLDYILEDFNIDLNDDVVEKKLVPVIMDVYNVVKVYMRNKGKNSTGISFDVTSNTDQQDFVREILDAVLETVFTNFTRKEVFVEQHLRAWKGS
ncbi:hypothetical protein PoB_005070000 [Plakobranchus ocellatus]|uniref:Uncharacterized protein n=1 Tax=Plakobranchus ocellatus TaxID=259542 RepID=A0AAV4BYG3_9GAST|nr:hypothetical protein PoB_005070000 [Plakobranchus ocellatus]